MRFNRTGPVNTVDWLTSTLILVPTIFRRSISYMFDRIYCPTTALLLCLLAMGFVYILLSCLTVIVVPYSPAFTGMPLYTKPPIFKNGQVVSDISACRTLFGDYGMSYYLKLFRKPCPSILGQNFTKIAEMSRILPSKAHKMPKNQNMIYLLHALLDFGPRKVLIYARSP